MITLIAAIGRNGEIGYNGRMPWHIPEDLKHFKAYTMGKIVVMGSKTFASLDNTPLPGRKNIVVSSQSLCCTTAIHASSIEHALSIEHCYPELVIIGGESVYRQTMGLADKLVITHIDSEFTADSYFPEIDPNLWLQANKIQSRNSEHNYSFVEYTRRVI
jgi:dihydrofolate reductase